MSGEEWEDLYKYRMSPVAFECCKISNGERLLSAALLSILKKIKIRLEYDFKRQLTG